MYNRYNQFPGNHYEITPSDTDTLSREMLIYAGSDGDISISDTHMRVVVYTVTAGTILPVLCRRVNETGTTVTQVIGLY